MPRFTTPNFRMVKATAEESRGMYHPPRVVEVTFRGTSRRLVIAAGRDDTIDVSRLGNLLVVCALSYRLPYFGAEVFDLDTGERIGSFFCQGAEQCAELFDQTSSEDGAPWSNWTLRYLFRQLRRAALDRIE